MRAQKGSSSFFNFGARLGWVVHPTTRPLYHQERNPLCVVQENDWASGSVWTGAENLYSRPPLIRINWDEELSGYAKKSG
jgi:hypothetical protein